MLAIDQVIRVGDQLMFFVVSGIGKRGQCCGACGGKRDRTWYVIVSIRHLELQHVDRYRIDVRSVAAHLHTAAERRCAAIRYPETPNEALSSHIALGYSRKA